MNYTLWKKQLKNKQVLPTKKKNFLLTDKIILIQTYIYIYIYKKAKQIFMIQKNIKLFFYLLVTKKLFYKIEA